MKKLLFVLTLTFIGQQSFCQRVVPELNQYYITSSLGYSGCKDADKLDKLMKAVRKMDNPTFMEYHNTGDCFVISGDLRVKVVFLSNDGHFVKLQREGVKAHIWTVTEALKEK